MDDTRRTEAGRRLLAVLRREDPCAHRVLPWQGPARRSRSATAHSGSGVTRGPPSAAATGPEPSPRRLGIRNCGSPSCAPGRTFPSLLERRRRIDQALFAVVMDAYLHGVSSRKIDDLVRASGADAGISQSEVSRIRTDLDAEVAAPRDRSLARRPIRTAIAQRRRPAPWLSTGHPPSTGSGNRTTPARRAAGSPSWSGGCLGHGAAQTCAAMEVHRQAVHAVGVTWRLWADQPVECGTSSAAWADFPGDPVTHACPHPRDRLSRVLQSWQPSVQAVALPCLAHP
jgi:hypothetical protein